MEGAVVTDVSDDVREQMHDRLEKLGVVERVHQILSTAFGVTRISDLTCWVERKVERGGHVVVFVKAKYVKHPQTILGQAWQPYDAWASFRVQQDMPFGDLRRAPLPSELVDEIYSVAGAPHSAKQ